MATVRRLTSGVTRSSAYPTRIVGRPASSSDPGGALRPRGTRIETKTLGANASVIGNLSVVEPAMMRMRRCSMSPSRSTTIHASAFVNGEAKRTVAVSPTEYRARSGITSILNCVPSLQGTQPGPTTQRSKVVIAARPARSVALSVILKIPPALGVTLQRDVVSAVVMTVQWATVSDTQSPTSSETPSRSRRTRCHSRRTMVPSTCTPDTFWPSGRAATTPIGCDAPTRQKYDAPNGLAAMEDSLGETMVDVLVPTTWRLTSVTAAS